MVKWNAFLSCLCGLAVAMGGVAASARADVTIEKGASVLIFPKVRSDANFDTIIQIANTGNSLVVAKCFYVNATGGTCQETDFTIMLSKQQPTHWTVSFGRLFSDPGIGPGKIPPMGPSFIGELKCIETDLFGSPVTGNHLKGEATIVATTTNTAARPWGSTTAGDVSKYNAIGIVGNPGATATNPLLLDGGTTYAACPAKQILNFFPSGSASVVAGTPTSYTELTLVPCTEDLENQLFSNVTVQFLTFNGYEQRFSASTTVRCFLNTELTAIDVPSDGTTANLTSVFSFGVLQTPAAQVEITPVGTTGSVVGVAERVAIYPANYSRAATNLHTQGDFVAVPPEKITMPAAF